jgi:CubicO group peptidase (beta-lactamase class C family)
VGECSSAAAALGRDHYVRHVLAAELQSAPGDAFLYSNDGYGLLGAIIEHAAGTAYEHYLREHLFAPARMTRTGYTFDDAVLADAARGYGRRVMFMGNLNPTFRNATGPAWCNRASGGLLSTAEDMYRWYLALRGTAILSERAKESLWIRHVPESSETTSFHGYGWTLSITPRQTRLAAHDGSLSGYYTADLLWYLDEDIALFVASNSAERPAQEASLAIARILFAK